MLRIWAELAWLVLARLVTGLGEALFFVGAATAAQDLADDRRRGEAASYFSVAIYGGLAAGPFLGEALYRAGSASSVWLVSAGLLGFAALVALLVPGELGRVPPDERPEGRPRLLHGSALLPGVVLLLGLFGFAAFAAFLPLYVDEIGLDDAGPLFLVYGLSVLAVRIFGARIPDRFGAVPTATTALVSIAAGVLVIGSTSVVAALYAGTVIFALGMSLLFPALFGLVVNRAPARERSHAVGTFSLFFDISQGVGAPLLGIAVTVAGAERAAFHTAAVIAVVGLVLARSRLASSQE